MTNKKFKHNKMYKRHTCIICGRKRYEYYMKEVLSSSWACTDNYNFQFCCDSEEIRLAEKIREDIKKLKTLKLQHIVGK